MSKTTLEGFTLLELIVTIAILAIFATIAVPTYQRLSKRSAITTTHNSLVAALHFARTHAIERDQSMRVCPIPNKDKYNCGDDWRLGWVVRRADGSGKAINIHQRESKQTLNQNPKKANIDIDWNGPSSGIVFDSNGFARGNLCGKNGNKPCLFSITFKNISKKTCIKINETGRVHTSCN